jgi:hypothetical protein
MQATASLSTKNESKGYGQATGVLSRTISSPSAFIDLGEPGNAVTKATFLYLKSDAPLDVRLTTDDGSGGDVVAVVPVEGLCLLEFSSSKHLKLLEVQGSGRLEYFVSGD